jgi:CheY-like chemotaxis protein
LGETILLVEDAERLRRLLHELLEQEGYRVIAALDPADAIGIVERHEEIDLLLTDVIIPAMDGRELARRVREKRPGIKVVYMSGYSGDALSAIGPSDGFLEKPFDPDTLREAIRGALG